MACHFIDNVYTKVFTPREYQVELLDTLKERNTIVCFGNNSTKLFLSVKLIQELAAEVRKPFEEDGKRSVFILDSKIIPIAASYIKHLTDLTVAQYTDLKQIKEYNDDEIIAILSNNQILVLTSDICYYLMTNNYLLLTHINLLVVDDCRQALKKTVLYQLLNSLPLEDDVYSKNNRILGFTTITLNQQCDPARLESEFTYLEKTFKSAVDTSSDIVTVLRYSSKPYEKIIICTDAVLCSLSEQLKSIILKAKAFIDDHRYDPFEIYDDEFRDELQNVPDPKVEPLEMIEDFLYILHRLGPWCADRAAFALLCKIENLKINTPYERHYLLFTMLSTVLISIRAMCDDAFQTYSTNTECVIANSTPRIHRLLEILKTFKPNAPTLNNDKEARDDGVGEVKTDAIPSSPTLRMGRSNQTGRGWRSRANKMQKRENYRLRMSHLSDQEMLCAIVFVEKRFTAKILFYLVSEMCRSLDELSYISVQYTVEKISDPVLGGKEAENEHRKQEEVLKKFRMHECNLLITTSVLEEGMDLPKCNLVVRFDQSLTYNSYVQSKGRAKMPKAYYVHLIEEIKLDELVNQMAKYREIEKMLLSKCKNRESSESEEQEADLYSNCIAPYTTDEEAMVNMTTAISLVNKYCAKLPSDTFTRLTPLWSVSAIECEEKSTCMYKCSIRLPINSPLKKTITGVAMPTRVLAKRVAALQVCKMLHKIGELDNNLLPVGKETFKAFEDDWNNFPMEEYDEMLTKNNIEPRPGTTKRRQYYYKRIASSLTNCRPLPSQPAYLYLINMTLTCPLPEEQNTRGRKIYPPEDSPQGFGILTLKQVPAICPFPIFTRSGEVQVSFELASDPIALAQEQLDKISIFLNYVFTNVLRLQKYLMVFDPDKSDNSYFIVPTIRNGSTTDVDWKFLDVIFEKKDLTPKVVPEENRNSFEFDTDKYSDAVVMPWYRNQDQPQYFYVAEVCSHLNPKSSFPGTDYKTFEEYYFKKYTIQIQNLQQPLLDVDHTSARLNFLTPRYVNRKGVALPTSSEETKRAKRENLEQKQILVPELCTIHPFPASLWRKAVCLPCILYRLNALLLADEIRKTVAEELALGQIDLPAAFKWEPLNFGWSLSDVLKKSREGKVNQEKSLVPVQQVSSATITIEKISTNTVITDDTVKWDGVTDAKPHNKSSDGSNWMEIGTWSNDMAQFSNADNDNDSLGSDDELPPNLVVNYDTGKKDVIRYGSPTSWIQSSCNDFDDYDSDDTLSYISDGDNSDDSNKSCGLRIEFKGDNTAEAIDKEPIIHKVDRLMLMAPPIDDVKLDEESAAYNDMEKTIEHHCMLYDTAVKENIEDILNGNMIIRVTEEFGLIKNQEDGSTMNEHYENIIQMSLNEEVVDSNVNQIAQNDALPLIDSKNDIKTDKFSFDFQPDLNNHSGPSPSVILQALTMSNANDGINLERLETIGDSFLKYAITNYLYSTYENIHEGKLSHLRSKQVSNLNLYRLGRAKILGESMIATKFDPHDNWLPPCYFVPRELEQALIDAKMHVIASSYWNHPDFNEYPNIQQLQSNDLNDKEIELDLKKFNNIEINNSEDDADDKIEGISKEDECKEITPVMPKIHFENLSNDIVKSSLLHSEEFYSPCLIPYNLITQHSIPDKSIADCVEALIGAYLIECGPRGALLFMAWLGIRVLPKTIIELDNQNERPIGSLKPEFDESTGKHQQLRYGHLNCPRSPLLHHLTDAQTILNDLLDGYSEFEDSIGYRFRDRSYLLQAMTHASYSPNTVTDCYQRLEFLGDAVLDFLITRHLYNDPRLHSPGALTDLRSALVNNTIFASLAVRHGFHKYFRHLSPGLHDVVNRFVQIQEENGHSISEEYYLITEDESEEIEDVEVPKALGDVFESVAGAIFCDSGMSLDAVWSVYYRMMHNEIEQFSTNVPKSPIRELLELEPETAKFGKPEKLADGRRVRVTVEVFGKGTFKGIGRNYRIAKCTAAKCALKQLKKRGMLSKKS